MRRKIRVKRRRPTKKSAIRRKGLKRGGRRLRSKGLSNVVRAGAYGAAAIAGYYGSKRRAGTRSGAKRKVIRDPNSYSQWEQFRFKRRLGRVTQRKLNGLIMDSTTYFWRTLNNIDGGVGNQYFSNYYTAGSNAGVPLYLVELNSCINNVNGNITGHSPVYKAERNESRGYVWSSLQGQTAGGVTLDSAWQVERSGQNSTITDNYPGQSSILSWVDIRMDLFGCKNHPTKFVIEVCQLDEDLCPAVGTNSDNNHVRFWDAQIRPFISNPNLHQISYGDKKYKKVIDSRVIEIGPTSTTESDQDPHVKTLQLFYKFNRRCNYAWKDFIAAPAENPSNAQLTTVFIPQAQGDNQTQVHPRARLFLLVRAVKFVRNALYGDQTNVDTPSWNLQVRTKHMVGL